MENVKNAYVVDEKGKCVVCFEEKIALVLDPCRHACLCKSCCDLISKRGSACPICRAIFTKTEVVGDNIYKAEIPKETLEKYIMTREDFIKKFNLTVEKKRLDLVIKGIIVDGFVMDKKVTDEVFEYYLGTHFYGDQMKVSSVLEDTEAIDICVVMDIMEEKNLSYEEAVSSIPFTDKMTYENFFQYVKSDIVPPEKLCKHLIDNYFQAYLSIEK